jgi:hypothetical protein
MCERFSSDWSPSQVEANLSAVSVNGRTSDGCRCRSTPGNCTRSSGVICGRREPVAWLGDGAVCVGGCTGEGGADASPGVSGVGGREPEVLRRGEGEGEGGGCCGGPMDRDWDLGGVAEGVVEAVVDLFVGEVDVVALLDAEAVGEAEDEGREGDPRILGADVVCPSNTGPSLSPIVRPRASATVAPALRALIRSVRPRHRLRCVVMAAGASVQTVPQALQTWMRRGGKSEMRKGKPGWAFLM